RRRSQRRTLRWIRTGGANPLSSGPQAEVETPGSGGTGTDRVSSANSAFCAESSDCTLSSAVDGSWLLERRRSVSTLYNFNAGPAMLPPSVLEQAQAELRDYQGRGLSITEMSHRSPEYEALNAQAEARFKRLLGVGADYRVVFLQGGASTQFAMV